MLAVLHDQGECWFQLRNSLNQTAGTPSLNPSVILKERLRTLAETASLMARAVVNKGNQTSRNIWFLTWGNDLAGFRSRVSCLFSCLRAS
ncbi:unnamed protein product [Dovyalis caffra]|uniref:Uncharacterized protein n=1 Tax=Dovyalis caffra TaxID=77055 RepID=A0AAV1RTQ0_9ROSI|nr:unnamed protein product [Dovyalis caffra]